jgi:hypothetical protein
MATWEEIVARYGITAYRLRLLSGLRQALDSLEAAGCKRAYVDGSFVTDKETPGDFDACWETAGVAGAKLEPVLLDFTNRRVAQKARFAGELFPADSAADRFGTRFLEFFQQDKDTGEPKGIVGINLGGIT